MAAAPLPCQSRHVDRLTLWLKSSVRWLTSQLMRGGRGREDAEDLTQEAYLRVHAYCARGEAREPEKVLVRTVMRLSINERRDKLRRGCVDWSIDALQVIDPSPEPEDVLTAQKVLGQIVKTLQTLEPRTREARWGVRS